MRLRARDEDDGARLDAFLAAPLGSRARAQRLIDEGAVRVDGAVVPKRHRMGAGETVTVELPPDPGPPAPVAAPAAFAVRYEDDDLLIVDKPAGVVVHPARGHRSGTLAQALAGVAAGGEEGRGRPVGRPDPGTAGAPVGARSAGAP